MYLDTKMKLVASICVPLRVVLHTVHACQDLLRALLLPRAPRPLPLPPGRRGVRQQEQEQQQQHLVRRQGKVGTSWVWLFVFHLLVLT